MTAGQANTCVVAMCISFWMVVAINIIEPITIFIGVVAAIVMAISKKALRLEGSMEKLLIVYGTGVVSTFILGRYVVLRPVDVILLSLIQPALYPTASWFFQWLWKPIKEDRKRYKKEKI